MLSKKDCDLSFFGEKAYSNKWQPIVKRTNGEKILRFPARLITTTLENGFYPKGFKGKEGTGIDFLSDIYVENGLVQNELECKGNFVWVQDFLNKELEQGTAISLSSKFGFNVLRHNQDEKQKTPSTLINADNNVGTNEDASLDLQNIFLSGVNEVFSYSKPVSLIEYLINMILYSSPDSIILDSFAGSGTTAHAVLNLNKQDGGNRKFILVEMEDYAETITAERVRRVIKGYGEGKNNVEGTGGNFEYFELGEPLLVDGFINENQPLENIRSYIFYTETKMPLQNISPNNEQNSSEIHPHYLGTVDGTSYYLYYSKTETTTLDFEFLGTIKNKAERYVIYADNCLLTKEFMFKHNINFKKIPRDVRRF